MLTLVFCLFLSLLLVVESYEELASREIFKLIECPPIPICFNCNLESNKCNNFGVCNEATGICKCSSGWGGVDCSYPLCGSLDSDERIPPPNKETYCTCNEGWAGLSCQVCQNNSICGKMTGLPENSVCYSGGVTVGRSYRSCEASLGPFYEKLLEPLKPRITLDLQKPFPDKNELSGSFQYAEENFYCKLDECYRDMKSTDLSYKCEQARCACIPGTVICDSARKIDLSPVLDDVRGPATLKCQFNNVSSCILRENVLDEYFYEGIGLTCINGECLRPSQLPDYIPPPEPSPPVAMIVGLVLLGIFSLVAIIFLAKSCLKRQAALLSADFIRPEDETQKLIDSHVPSTLSFDSLSYSIKNKKILRSLSGIVKPGQVMAIMGGSGSGKTTALDILSGKKKQGTVNLNLRLNGDIVEDRTKLSKLCGFVDQEDTLLGTLTVRETLMYSALLRLPYSMSLAAKKLRVQETMEELRIDHLADRFVGLIGRRGISGGEKKRLSIAQELVTSPSILFLDEPTSGLDSYNAFVVVETLLKMATKYNRTVIMSIHQPRSNIFALFDQVLLLASGRMVYSGAAHLAANHFACLGYPCPAGFNTADFLIDITLKVNSPEESTATSSEEELIKTTTEDSDQPLIHGNEDDEDSGERQKLLIERVKKTHDTKVTILNNLTTSKTPYKAVSSQLQRRHTPLNESNISLCTTAFPEIKERITYFESSWPDSEAGKSLVNELLESYNVNNYPNYAGTQESLVSACSDPFYSKKEKPHLWSQFLILSGRTLINLYRNPFLLVSHYIISILLAVFCGVLYWHVTNDTAGVQNRLGVLFFIIAFFGFGSMSSLEFFSAERIIFTRERSNGFYSVFPYYISKIFFDIIPLRVVPPILFGSIVYYMVGLYPATEQVLKFLLVLVLFNVSAASICFAIGIVIEQAALANLTASLTILFSMLFGGFLLNKENMSVFVSWIKYLSIFNYAYEALIVNELVKVTLRDTDIIDIEIPGPLILKRFGFDVNAYWKDVTVLGIFLVSFLLISFILLKLFVKERR